MTLELDTVRIDVPGGAEAVAAGDGVAPPGSLILPEMLLTPDNKRLYSRGILRRRSAPVVAYVGTSGHGKSLSMVRDTLPSLALGRPVLSTVTLLDPATGNPHPLFIPFERWEQLRDFHDGDLLLDEITGVMDSRDSGPPKWVRKILPQMRRRNVMVRWTGLDWDNSDKRMRQATWAVVKSKGLWPDRDAVRMSTGERDAVPMWAPNRLFRLTTFDAQTLASSDDSRTFSESVTSAEARRRVRRPKVLGREFFWGPGSVAFAAYRTLDAVLGVDNSCAHVNDDGTVCGLRIAEPTCQGHGENRRRR